MMGKKVLNFLRNIDLVFWLLRLNPLLYLAAFNAMKRHGEDEEVQDSFRNNIHKQSLIVYITVIFAWWMFPELLQFLSLRPETLGTMVAITLSVYASMVVVWYVISFGAVPKQYLKSAMLVTFLMLLALTMAATLLGMILFIVFPTKIACVFFAPILISWLGSTVYDSMDLLKAGSDAEGLKFFRLGQRGLPAIASNTELLKQILEELKKQN